VVISDPTPFVEVTTIDHESMWRQMSRLLERVHGATGGDALLDDCLDIVVELLDADRGLTLMAEPAGGLRVINARGHKKALAPPEREEVSKTIIHQALGSRRCVVWDPLTAAAAPSSSFASLGMISALAAPLHAGPPRAAPRGVLYVDFRDPRKPVGDSHVEFFMSAAILIGAVLAQHERGQETRAHLREAQTHCVDATPTPALADLLASPTLRSIRREVDSSLHGDAPILIVGESGTGKTLLAQAIAEASGRRPIVRAVLGSSDDLNTITSELFGHERGAYSGATSRRVGLVEYANGGTLILDEILNLPPHAQQLLLDFTQFGAYRPLGHAGPEPRRARVRVIAATNGDLRAAIRERRFREDLYYRLAAVTLELPPLRARREDIPALAEQTLRRIDPARAWSLSVPLRRLLVSAEHGWPGNIRQLERAVERARERAVAQDPCAATLGPEHFDTGERGAPAVAALTPAPAAAHASLSAGWLELQAARADLDGREQELLREALRRSDGVIAHAARELGIARTTLSSRIDALRARVTER
jgi:transcriptional regulator with GAF, ATPase, and Fis domain